MKEDLQIHRLKCPDCNAVLVYNIQWERHKKSFWSCKFCDKNFQDYEVMKGVMICAWCGDVTGPSNIEDGSNSHGMCKGCADAKSKELEKMRVSA